MEVFRQAFNISYFMIEAFFIFYAFNASGFECIYYIYFTLSTLMYDFNVVS